ncbi:MAG TPA: DUF885 family protein [Rhizomicrobium sp.]|nr:DUF885 family protein [Rhizomicrobium sp.]
MRIWIVGLGCTLAIAMGCASARAADGTEARFRSIYEQEWAWREEQYPGDDETKPFPDRLPKEDSAAHAARLKYWREVMKKIEAVRVSALPPEEKVNYAVYKPQIAILVSQEEFRDYEMPANSDSAFWSDISTMPQHRLKTETDYRSYVRWLNDIPRYFRDAAANMRAGLVRRFTPPKVTMAGRDKSIAAIASAAGESNVYYQPLKVMPASIPVAERAQLRRQVLAAIRLSVVPAYGRLLKFVRDEYIPKCRTTLAAEALPDGEAYYRSKILEYTTRSLDPDAIYKTGLSEVATIHAHMLDAMRRTGFKGDFPAFLRYLRTEPKFYAKTPEELLMHAAWIAKRFDGVASQFFGYLPRQRFGIEPVPAPIAPYYTSGRGGPGVYYVNTYDLRARPLYNLTALTLHESAPGHAFQIPIAEEHKAQPPFRQNAYISAYGEGWAVYSERLGVEMGLYETPYDVFGMWTYQAWRACRLVVDTGIHAKGWTRERAQQYLHENTALTDHEIETEVDRYIGWPGQALSYYVGASDIWRNRERAEKALGAKFNIRAFHDAVLELGSVPLTQIDARIDRFIVEGGKGPYPDLE